MRETESLILFLRGWQSNFSVSPFQTEGLQFLQVEQYFMYQKARFFADDDSMQKILAATTAQQARDLGQLLNLLMTHGLRYVIISCYKGIY